jgi:hypothetical protein
MFQVGDIIKHNSLNEFFIITYISDTKIELEWVREQFPLTISDIKTLNYRHHLYSDIFRDI